MRHQTAERYNGAATRRRERRAQPEPTRPTPQGMLFVRTSLNGETFQQLEQQMRELLRQAGRPEDQ